MTQIIIPFKFNAEGVVRFIAQGWRQPTLGYACSEEVNAVGVVRFSAWNAVIKYRGIKGTTPTALFSLMAMTQGSLRFRSPTLGYQRYNAYSVAR